MAKTYPHQEANINCPCCEQPLEVHLTVYADEHGWVKITDIAIDHLKPKRLQTELDDGG
jgi:hypothetical protein